MGGIECCAARDKDDDVLSISPSGSGKSILREIRRITLISTPGDHSTPASDEHFSHHFSTARAGRIDDYYEINKDLLGQGSHGVVRRALGRSSPRVTRAVKSISLEHLRGKKQQMLAKEINIMVSMDHPHIVKLYETFKDAHFIYLVMELCLGGEFFDRIVRDAKEGFEENRAALYMQQILSAVCYVHKHGVVHRDIKPENFLLSDTSDEAVLKLIDFGVAAVIKPGQMLETKTGTASYVAPEVLHCRYNERADIWSCGILCFILLSGGPPFTGASQHEIMKKVRKAEIVFKSSVWNNVSDSAKVLVRRMLTRDFQKRPSGQELLQDAWICDTLQPRRRKSNVNTVLLSHFRSFHQANQFKKIVTTMIATMLADEDIKELREQFEALDTKGDGSISKEELARGLKRKMDSNAVTNKELEEIMEDLDSDGSGEIDWTEFLAAAIDKRKLMQREVMWNAFRRFDLNGDGKITKEELRKVCTGADYQDFSGKKIELLMAEADEDGDGSIDFNEFMQVMQR